MNEEVIQALLIVIDALERLQVSYAVGGSIASMLYGELRTTLDADLVADLPAERAAELVAALRSDFYVEEVAVRRAIDSRSSFNVIHLRSLCKVDIFLPRNRPFDREQLRRRRLEVLARNPERRVYVTAPEDIVLHKLEWFRAGGGVSDRQWRDLVGILKVMDAALDHAYLQMTARDLGVDDLLTRARGEAGSAAGEV